MECLSIIDRCDNSSIFVRMRRAFLTWDTIDLYIYIYIYIYIWLVYFINCPNTIIYKICNNYCFRTLDIFYLHKLYIYKRRTSIVSKVKKKIYNAIALYSDIYIYIIVYLNMLSDDNNNNPFFIKTYY